jgi:hypothetical protein
MQAIYFSITVTHIYNPVKMNNWNFDGTVHCIGSILVNGNNPLHFAENLNLKKEF